MTRADTEIPPYGISITQNHTIAYLIKFAVVIVLLTFVTGTLMLIKKPVAYLGDTITEGQDIPKTYNSLEGVDPEEKDIFHGFRTSFLPAEEVMLAQNHLKFKRGAYEGNANSDFFIWDSFKAEAKSSNRQKRTSTFSLTSQDYDTEEDHPLFYHREEKEFDKESTEDSDEDYDSEETSSQPEDEGIESIVRPHTHVDRGPLDDVVEQIRGQPELEEGEMETAARLYKPAPAPPRAGIHAFWKGQGDKDTIRATQASIMKRNMDAGADPCHDFYQYACGNWAALNPIPADKAGYDTFEMLRENLDAVLKDLLEFHGTQPFQSRYPGAHLDLNYYPQVTIKQYQRNIPGNKLGNTLLTDTLEANSREVINNTNEGKYRYDWMKPDEEKSGIAKYLHKLVNRKIRAMSKTPNKQKEYLQRQNKRSTTFKQHQRNLPGNTLIINTLEANQRVIINSTNEGKYRYNWMKPDEEKLLIANHINKSVNKKTRATSKASNKQKKYIKRLKKRSSSSKLNIGNVAKILHSKRKRRSLKRKFIKTMPVIRRTLQTVRTVRKNRIKRGSNRVHSRSQDVANGDAALKAKFLFRSCMNYEIIQKRGHQPLLDLLNLLGGWPILDVAWDSSNFDWLDLMAKLRLYNNDILISEWVGPDIKNSDEFIIQFDQTSLGLPTREYFLQDSNKVYLNAYKNYLIKVAILLGGDKTHVLHSANQLIDFEIKLAKITSAPEDRRNVSELYQKMTLLKLEKLVPEIKWRRYLCTVMNRTVGSDEIVVLFALTYVRHLVKLVNNTEPQILANYLLWRFVRHRVNNLDDKFQSAKQQFYFILFGREQAPPRWKNCISQVNSNMGMALGSMFVKKHFDETSKNDTLTMTREIQQSFRELLHKITWIDDETKHLAAQKVDVMTLRIGYPDFILNKKELDQRYKDVTIHPDKYFENILNILQHLTQMEQSRIGQPVNKTLWNTAPAVVNAYYSRNKNQIMFPAGILQPPFYHRHFPRSLNYGGIGVVIGHEITHGFDDKGRLFDCNGNLHRWWSDSAIEAFHRRAQCLIDQYGRYVVPEVNVKLDGVNTQGENIADNGGVKQAFRAYIHWVQKHGAADETLPGLNHTHTQLFFLNFAQVWCGAMRSEAMRNKLKTAVHSPGRFRVIGTLSNSHDFAREFKCPLGSPMNPKEKCTVW